MVTVGTLRVKGVMDTKEVDRGFNKLTDGFRRTKRDSKSTGGTLAQLSSIGSSLGTVFSRVGIAASGFLAKAAKEAPALAPAMASIGVSMGRSIRAFGEGAQPIFERVSGWLEKFATWSEAHPNLFASLVTSLTTISVLKYTGILGLLSKLAGFTISAVGLSTLGTIAAIGAGAVGFTAATAFISKAIGGGMANQAEMHKGIGVPLPDAAKSQIANASPSELLDLQNRYAMRVGNFNGPDRTPQIDMQTGELYGNQHMQRDIINAAMESMGQLNITINTRDLVLNQADTFFNG